jgi:hypothetical protein
MRIKLKPTLSRFEFDLKPPSSTRQNLTRLVDTNQPQPTDFKQIELKIELNPDKKHPSTLTSEEIFRRLDQYLLCQLSED